MYLFPQLRKASLDLDYFLFIVITILYHLGYRQVPGGCLLVISMGQIANYNWPFKGLITVKVGTIFLLLCSSSNMNSKDLAKNRPLCIKQFNTLSHLYMTQTTIIYVKSHKSMCTDAWNLSAGVQKSEFPKYSCISKG